MCMKYVNATVECFSSVGLNQQGQPISFLHPLNTITAVREPDGSLSIGNFVIRTCINVLGTNNEAKKAENPISLGSNLSFILRLTKCAENAEDRLGLDLETYEINLAELKDKKKLNRACYDFLNYSRTANIEKITLPSNAVGGYVLKVLVHDNFKHNNYTIQAMNTLFVKEPLE